MAPPDQQIWASLRGEFGITTERPAFSIGYHFDVAGAWSTPEDPDVEVIGVVDPSNQRAVLRTYFVDSAGRDCGNVQIAFRRVSTGGEAPSYLEYLVDEMDLEPVMRLITSCAAGR